MASSQYSELELALVLMEALREVNVDSPLQIRPDLTEFILALPEEYGAKLYRRRGVYLEGPMATDIFFAFHDVEAQELVFHTGQGWALTEKGRQVGQQLLQKHQKLAVEARKRAIHCAFEWDPCKETWLAVGELHGWSK